jgi:hypothetical protein
MPMRQRFVTVTAALPDGTYTLALLMFGTS